MSKPVDREMQEAYVDGDLSPEDAARVVMYLADNPDAQAYVERLTELNKLLSVAFEAPIQEPVPARIQSVFQPTSPARSAPRKTSRWNWKELFSSGWLMPAGVAAAAFAFLVYIEPDATNPLPAHSHLIGAVSVDSELHDILDSKLSGYQTRLSNHQEITLIFSFLDRDKTACREYEIRAIDSSLTRSIACATPDQNWDIRGSFSEQITSNTLESGFYLPAGGAANSGASTLLDTMGAGPVLTPEEEEAMIINGWR